MKLKLEPGGARFTSAAALILLALSFNPRANARSLTTNGEYGVFNQPLAEDVRSPQCKLDGPQRIQGQAIQVASICQSPSLSSRVACTIALCLALAGIIADPTTCHAQSPSEWSPATSENAMNPDLHPAQEQITRATATLKNEEGLEVSYGLAITPALRLIPSYQHTWNPMTAGVAKNERGADVLLLRLILTF